MKLIDILREIGDASAKPFPLKSPSFKRISDQLKRMKQNMKWKESSKETEVFVYKANTGERSYDINIEYTIIIQNKESEYTYEPEYPMIYSYITVGFTVTGAEDETITNFNERFRLIATVIEAIKDFCKNMEKIAPVYTISIEPKSDSENTPFKSDTKSKRGRFYSLYITNERLKDLPGNWEIRDIGFEFTLTRKS